MSRICIDVAVIEFDEGGNTMWIHGPQGGTVLRIKTKGHITSKQCNTSPVSHADVMVDDDIEFCLGTESEGNEDA